MSSLIIFGAQYLYLVIVIGALWYIFLQKKEMRLKIVVCAMIALPLSYVIAKAMSLLYYDPRPFVVGQFVPLLPHAPDNGFPSDHTLLSSAVAAVIFFFHRKTGLILFVVTFLVGTARVLAGIHHFVDILGSIVIATVVTFIVFKYISPKVWLLFSSKYQQTSSK